MSKMDRIINVNPRSISLLQKADAFESMSDLQRSLNRARVAPEALRMTFGIDNSMIEPLTFFPEPVMKYRRVGAPVDAKVVIDASARHASLGMRVSCNVKPGMKRVFAFNKAPDSDDFVCTTGKNSSTVPRIDVERTVLELALSQEQQSMLGFMMNVDAIKHIDLSNPSILQLLAISLRGFASNMSQREVYRLPRAKDTEESRFVINSKPAIKSFSYGSTITAMNGFTTNRLTYNLTASRISDPDSAKVTYSLSTSGKRLAAPAHEMILRDNGQRPDQSALIEYSLAAIKSRLRQEQL